MCVEKTAQTVHNLRIRHKVKSNLSTELNWTSAFDMQKLSTKIYQ